MSARKKLATDVTAFLDVDEAESPPPILAPDSNSGDALVTLASPATVQEEMAADLAHDSRAEALAAEGNLADAVQRALASAAQPFAEADLIEIADSVRTIRAGQAAVQNVAVEIGTALNKLFHLVGNGGFRALKARELVTLSEGSVSQYRAIATMVSDGVIARDLLPHSVNAAYALFVATRRSPEILQPLIEDGTVTPNATKKVIIEAAERVRHQISGATTSVNTARLQRRLGKLRAEAERIERILKESGSKLAN